MAATLADPTGVPVAWMLVEAMGEPVDRRQTPARRLAETLGGVREDAGYCGACGTSCRKDQVCGAGSCGCAEGENECSSLCVNMSTDPQHCGVCDITCRADEMCTEGKCTCASGKMECKSACITSLEAAGYCGACGTTCQSGQTCVDGTCKKTPCDNLCPNPEPISAAEDGFRVQSLGSAERCLAIEGYFPTSTNPTLRIVCWNLDNARTLQVNGKSVPCWNASPPDAPTAPTGYPLSQTSLGWYCVQVTAGADNSAGFILPTR